MKEKKPGLAAFCRFWYFFLQTGGMAINIIENLTIFGIFFTFLRRSRYFFWFLERDKTFLNEKSANFKLMAKSKFVLNYIGYFSKKLQEPTSHFFGGFSSISPKVLVRENQCGIHFKAILSIGIEFSWKNTKIKKNIFSLNGGGLTSNKSAKCIVFFACN